MSLEAIDPGPLPPSIREMEDAIVAYALWIADTFPPQIELSGAEETLMDLAIRATAVRENVPQDARGVDSDAVEC